MTSKLREPDARAVRATSRDHVSLPAFDRAEIAIEVSPVATVGLLAFDAVQRHSHLGTPAPVRRALRSRLRTRDLDILRVFDRSAAPTHLVGSAVAPTLGFARALCGTPWAGPRFADGIDEFAETDPDAFFAASASCVTHAPAEAWSLLSSDARRWMHGYARALHGVWEELKPLWRSSRSLLDREVERVEAAAAHGVRAELVTALHPRAATTGETWALPAPDTPVAAKRSPGPYDVAPRFTVSPMLTGHRATVVLSDALHRATSLHYPLQQSWQAFEDELPPPASLEAIIGQHRVTILKQLDAPTTAGRIAELLYMVPAGATHHLRSLEAAGLVSRTRRGRHVIVERTVRGDALLALYDEP